jgi:hypothetical protein
MKKEYIIFKNTGEFVFTSSNEPLNYVNDSNFVVIYSDRLDYNYSYSLINGVITKGNKWPEIIE